MLKTAKLSVSTILELESKLEEVSKIIKADRLKLAHALARTLAKVHSEVKCINKAIKTDPEFIKEYRELAKKIGKRDDNGQLLTNRLGDFIPKNPENGETLIDALREKYKITEAEEKRRAYLDEEIEVEYYPLPTGGGFPPELTAHHLNVLLPFLDNPDFSIGEEPKKPV